MTSVPVVVVVAVEFDSIGAAAAVVVGGGGGGGGAGCALWVCVAKGFRELLSGSPALLCASHSSGPMAARRVARQSNSVSNHIELAPVSGFIRGAAVVVVGPLVPAAPPTTLPDEVETVDEGWVAVLLAGRAAMEEREERAADADKGRELLLLLCLCLCLLLL